MEQVIQEAIRRYGYALARRADSGERVFAVGIASPGVVRITGHTGITSLLVSIRQLYGVKAPTAGDPRPQLLPVGTVVTQFLAELGIPEGGE